MSGTLRTFDIAQRDDLVKRAEAAIDHVAETYGATADFAVRQNAALVYNDQDLSAWLAPVLEEAAGAGNVNPASPPTTVAEDFSYFQGEVPGVFYHLGGTATASIRRPRPRTIRRVRRQRGRSAGRRKPMS